MDRRLSDLLHESVRRGVITAEQRDQMLAAAAEERGVQPRTTSGEVLLWAREVPRGFNAITVAYGVGSFAIMFALGWFLADRWNALGPVGVLAVSLVYTGIFALAARIFSRESFPTAHGIAILLIVCVTPLIVWSLLRASGIWVRDDVGMCGVNNSPFWDCGAHPVILSAATCACALIATRWIRFGPLMIPGAVSLAIGLTYIALEVSRGGSSIGAPAWAFVFSASMIAALAYEVDRRRGREDYARWLHLVAALCAASALIGLFDAEREFRVLLLPTAIALMAASLFLRRVVWLVLGLGALFSYFTWLARDVFKETIAFPVILILVGLSVILVTVWVQRTYPRLAARVRSADGAMAHIPGGAALLLAPALVAVFVMPVARDEAHWRRIMERADWRRQQIELMRIQQAKLRARVTPRPIVVPPPVPAATDSARDSSAFRDTSSFRETSLSKGRTEGLTPKSQDR